MEPTGVNKILVEKYGYEWVNGKAWRPGTAPKPEVPTIDVTPGPLPDWITPPPADALVTQALETLTNPVTGEKFTVPTGGYTVNVSALTPIEDTSPTPSVPVATPEPEPAPTEPVSLEDKIEQLQASLSELQKKYEEALQKLEQANARIAELEGKQSEPSVGDQSSSDLDPKPEANPRPEPETKPSNPEAPAVEAPEPAPTPSYPEPTGVNKILVEKYGYEWVNGKAWKPGTAPEVVLSEEPSIVPASEPAETKPISPNVKVSATTYFSNQPLGEDAALLDLDLDGSEELFVFTSSTRSPYHSEQNDIAIFKLSEDKTILSEHFKIDYFYDGFDASRVTMRNDTFTTFQGDFKIGWLQDAEVADFNGDGKEDLFFSGHGRELELGVEDFALSDHTRWPGDYIKIALSDAQEIKIITVNEDLAFWHAADIGDVDGDGDNDVVAVISSGPEVGYKARAWLNDGLANFEVVDLPDTIDLTTTDYWNLFQKNDFFVSSVVSVGNITPLEPEDLVFARIRAIGTSATELLQIYNWDGDKFQKVNEFSPNMSSLERITGLQYDAEKLHADKIATEDIDGDGDDDIAVSILYNDNYHTTMVLENLDGYNYSEYFAATNLNSGDDRLGGDGPTLLDINGDGHLDLINAGWIGKTYWPDFIKNVFLNNGKFDFIPLTNFIDPLEVPDRINSEVEGNVQFNVIKDGETVLFSIRGGHVYDQDLGANISKFNLVTFENMETIDLGSYIM